MAKSCYFNHASPPFTVANTYVLTTHSVSILYNISQEWSIVNGIDSGDSGMEESGRGLETGPLSPLCGQHSSRLFIIITTFIIITGSIIYSGNVCVCVRCQIHVIMERSQCRSTVNMQ